MTHISGNQKLNGEYSSMNSKNLKTSNFLKKIVNKKYSFIKTKEKFSVEKDVKNSIIRNVKALFLHNIGSYCVFSTDNLLIGTFININTVGLYSNYTMVISQLKGILTTMLNGIANSVGNLIATESSRTLQSFDD